MLRDQIKEHITKENAKKWYNSNNPTLFAMTLLGFKKHDIDSMSGWHKKSVLNLINLLEEQLDTKYLDSISST